MSTPIYPLIEAEGIEHVGGKALHLGELLRAGFPVPGGFVITTTAYKAGWSDELAAEILAAWQAIGAPRVAVSSSATAEDLDGASMAGQYDTYLNIDTEAGLLEAVKNCWSSIDTERTRSYLAGQDLTPDQVAMAVVVQRQVAADVAGVLFTADPQQAGADEMVVEASWGLGEAVVSGLVQPDLYRLDGKHGKLKSLTVADKQRWIPSGHGEEEQDVPENKRRKACLKTADLLALWQLGKRAEQHYAGPQDIEWAISDGELLMLQARAITTLGPHQARLAVLDDIKIRLTDQDGPWVRHNLGETLTHPHPLTWSVIRRFMSGAGGFGDMYRMVGFEPGPAVADDGFLELIAGNIYMDCARSPDMFFEDYPVTYDAELLQNNPGAAQDPPTLPVGTAGERNKVNKKLIKVGATIEAMTDSLAAELRSKTIPEFEAWCAGEKQRDLTKLEPAALIQCWKDRDKKIFDDMAPQIFLPSLVEGHLQQTLRTKIAEVCWDRDPEELLQMLSVSEEPDATMRSNIALEQVANGDLSLNEWIDRFGHRCPGEFDFAVPRWRERPEDALKLSEVFKKGGNLYQLHQQRLGEATAELNRITADCPASDRAELISQIEAFKRYLPFREDGKDSVIRGCDLLRDVATEMGHRLELGSRVFWLKESELFQALETGYVPENLLEDRAARYQAEASIELPPVILAEQLDQLGDSDANELPDGDRLPALTVSRGLTTGSVCIVHKPEEAGDLCDNYVLVCPSTDPSWTPLFVNAVAVVLERGGALSHGAVVAREMGVPAVVLPNATRLFQNGEAISIDGDRGAVIRVSDTPAEEPADAPNDLYFSPEMIPPPVGSHERKSGKWALWASGLWGLFLGLVFLLPPHMLHNPTLRLMDSFLWPLVNLLGRPGALALVAVIMSALLMIFQRVLTDNNRMLAARDRAAKLREVTKKLAVDSPRKKHAEALAKPVTMRMLVAAMVPIALLLGPLCMLFTWFPARLAPTAQNAPAGSAVTVVVTIDGEWQEPVRLQLDDERLELEGGNAEQTLPPIRATLENLRSEWTQTEDLSDYPWSVRAAALKTRENMLADLNGYLRRGVPPQTLVWTLRAPENVAGSFAFSVHSQSVEPIAATIRLGNSIPAIAEFDEVLTDTALQKIKIAYPPNPTKAVFWTPFAKLGWPIDIGWLWTYLLAYLPPMFILKKILKVA